MNDEIQRSAVKLSLETLEQAVASGAAFRCRRRLQPAGGEGDKVFPPTFAGAVYAIEQRRVPGRPEPVTCVVLDTVQSQANRMEEALQEAVDANAIPLPLIEVDFSPWTPNGGKPDEERLLDDVGKITSLQVPHRLADAILRDSETEDGTPFRKSDFGRELDEASQRNATALFRLCPTALIFGMWDSTGPKGGLGAKFERVIVSEVVGIGASFGVKTASRIDPLITKTDGIEVYVGRDGTWTTDPAEAKQNDKGELIKLGKGQKTGKVSNANLGNVTPSFAEYGDGAAGPDPLKIQQLKSADFRLSLNNPDMLDKLAARKSRVAAGGVSVEYAEQLTTLSLIALRRLRFPVDGAASAESAAAARTVLAALGLCAATLATENGLGLRSRCLLWPEETMAWELLAKPGEPPQRFALTGEEAIELLKQAAEKAEECGLEWSAERVTLRPQAKLVKLVRASQIKAVEADPESED